MPVLIFFVLCVGIWALWIKLSPNHSDLIKIKFDYIGENTSFYGKGAVIGAIAFWLLLLVVGILLSDIKTTAIILGIVSGIYVLFVVSYLRKRNKQRRIKKEARQIPGKIVGVKKVRESYDRNRQRRRYSLYLIVEFQNPDTLQTEEFTTKESVNGSPFLYLRSLDVTVYYRDADHIFVGGFQRIKRLKDNIAYQVTGRVDGKDPGILRYEEEQEDKTKE